MKKISMKGNNENAVSIVVPEYGDDTILTKEGLDHMSHRGTSYGFTQFGKEGIFLMCKEILDNAIDEANVLKDQSHNIEIIFIKKKRGFQAIIKDTGRGVPPKMIAPSFTVPGTSGKWEEAYYASAGTNGMGAKGVVALSTDFLAISKRDTGSALLTVHNKIITSDVQSADGATDTGTLVIFDPDVSIMKNALSFYEPDGAYDDFMKLIDFMVAYLDNTAITVYEATSEINIESFANQCPMVTWDTIMGIDKRVVHNPDPATTLQQHLLKINGVHHPVVWDSGWVSETMLDIPVSTQTGENEKKTAKMGYRVNFFITGDYMLRKSHVLGSVNTIVINKKSASHVLSLIDSIKAKLHSLVNEAHQEFFMDSYVLPIQLVSIIDWQHAVFQNQEKSSFVDDDFTKGFRKCLNAQFNALGSVFWENLSGKLADDIRIKWESKNRRDFDLAKSVKNLAFSLHNPNCYYECRNTGEGTELLICEGVSSGDYVKQLRDEDNQAVFELKGKTLNSTKGSMADLRRNKVLADLINVIGTSPSDTELEDFRFSKIGILTDGDADGYHITSLMLDALHKINPKLCEDGKIFLLCPPLYVVTMKGSVANTFYVRDQNALMHLRSQTYEEAFRIKLQTSRRVNHPHLLTGESFLSMVALIKYMGDVIIDVANKQNVEPVYLEMLVYCLHWIKAGDMGTLAAAIGASHCAIDTFSNSLSINVAGYETIIPLNGLVNELESRIVPLFTKHNVFDFELLVTTTKTGFYDDTSVGIMQLYYMFDEIDKIYSVSRMKGLGEMSKKGLHETCLDKATRTIIEIQSPGDVSRIFALMGVNTDTRKKLVSGIVE